MKLFLASVVILSVLNALIFVLLRKPTKLYKIFGWYLILCGVFESAAYFSIGNNHNLFQVYAFLEISLLTFFFISLFKLWPRMWYLYLLVLALFAFFLFREGASFDLSMYEKNVFDFLVVIVSIVALFYLLNISLEKDSDRNVKYFIFGLLLNFAGSFSIYLFLEQISSMSESAINTIWSLKIGLNILAQLLFLTGIVRYQHFSYDRG